MPWLRLDDRMGGHRKTRRVLRAGGLRGLAAFGTHVLGLLHSAEYLTDGFVEDEFVEETFDLARVREGDREPILDVLRTQGLWLPARDGGFELHDYLDYNPSRAEVEAQRDKDAERKRRGRAAQGRKRPSADLAESGGHPAGVRADAAGTGGGRRAESDGPDPTRPVPELPPLPPEGGRARDHERFAEEMQVWAEHHFPDAEDYRHVVNAVGEVRARGLEPTPAAIADWARPRQPHVAQMLGLKPAELGGTGG